MTKCCWANVSSNESSIQWFTVDKFYFDSIFADKEAVEKRLYILQKQGFIYSTPEAVASEE